MNEPARIPFWAWGLVAVGGALILGALKMGVFYQKHGKKAERRCAGKKTRAAYNRCIRKALRGRKP